MIDTELKIWAAGAFDGEGSALVTVASTPGRCINNSFQIVVAVVNTDMRFITPFQDSWGGNLVVKPSWRRTKDGGPRKEAYQLNFDPNGEAQALLEDVYPYLRVKREVVLLVLKALEARRNRHTSRLGLCYLEGVTKGFWKMSKNYIP